MKKRISFFLIFYTQKGFICTGIGYVRDKNSLGSTAFPPQKVLSFIKNETEVIRTNIKTSKSFIYYYEVKD